jgi:hypothetical protein
MDECQPGSQRDRAALSSLTSATATNSINNTSFPQTWQWNSLTNGTALTISSSSMTTGSLLSLQDTAASATSTGQVLSISDATTGSGYGIYSAMTGHGNTGYAGYFINTDTSSTTNIGVYATVSSSGTGIVGNGNVGVYGGGLYLGVQSSSADTGAGGAGVWGQDYGSGIYGQNTTTAAGYGIYGTITGHGNTGYAGYFINTDTSSNTNYGVYSTTASTGSGFGVYAIITGAANTGYAIYAVNSGPGNAGVAGYFANTATAGAYALVGSSASTINGNGVYGEITGASNNGYAGKFYDTGVTNTGYAGYFSNTGTGAINYGLYASTSSATGCIEPLDTVDALDEIAALRPVTFTWKKTGASDMGLIAQEVDTVLPELVTHGGADETLALKYTSLIAPIIASIQELKKRDDELELENASLRRDFETYKAAHP